MSAVTEFSRAQTREETQGSRISWLDVLKFLLIIFTAYMLIGFATAYDGKGSYMPFWHWWLHHLRGL